MNSEKEKFLFFIGIVIISVIISTVINVTFSRKTLGSYNSPNGSSNFTDLNVSNDLVVNKRLKIGASANYGYGHASDTDVSSGCLIIGDSTGSTTAPVYITATGSTLTATTTMPGICY